VNEKLQFRENLQRLQIGSRSSSHATVAPPQRTQIAETSCDAGRTSGSFRRVSERLSRFQIVVLLTMLSVPNLDIANRFHDATQCRFVPIRESWLFGHALLFHARSYN